GSNRVLRGGSWNNNARNCRVSNRNNNSPDNRNNNNNGFRLVLSPAHRHSRIAAIEQIVDLFPPLWDK
nr:SUMF1/EgtB/PvdO family nonheme iron enzyme [Bacteroidales bacterium]